MRRSPHPRCWRCRGTGFIVTNDPRPGDGDVCPLLDAENVTTKDRPNKKGATA